MENQRKCDRWYGAKHKFDQWKVKEDNLITRIGERKNEVIGRWILQERKCSKCGFVEFNKQQINLT